MQIIVHRQCSTLACSNYIFESSSQTLGDDQLQKFLDLFISYNNFTTTYEESRKYENLCCCERRKCIQRTCKLLPSTYVYFTTKISINSDNGNNNKQQQQQIEVKTKQRNLSLPPLPAGLEWHSATFV